MSYAVLLKKIEPVTHDVIRLLTEKPKGYDFQPGQATEMAIDKENFRKEKRPFTFTSLPQDEELEFTIKMYPSHDGVTGELSKLKVGDSLLIGNPWGAITYQGEGTFIAGGAGITPFIAILKDLNRKGNLRGNRLFFGNKMEKDIIYKNNLEAWLNDDFINTLSKEDHEKYHHGRIDRAFLQSNNLEISKKVYLCGPPPMIESLQFDLYDMGISRSQLVIEDLN